LDDSSHHPLTCKVGGHVVARHDAVRTWLFGLVKATLGPSAGAQEEQYVPRWDRQREDGTVERAKLDVTYVHNGRRVFVDVSVVSARSNNAALRRTRAARDGAAAAREEDSKRLRYPGPDLRPFAVEALGRPGESAAALLRELAPAEPQERSAFLAKAWQDLSVLVQRGNAELLLRAEH
jgi:hypothetical protein